MAKKQGGKVVLILELRDPLFSFLSYAELNGSILSEYRMAIYSGLEKHRPNLNSATALSLTVLLNESDEIESVGDVEGVKVWAKAWRKKLGI